MKKRVWIDMDGVLCDFYNTAKDFIAKNPNIKYPQSRYGFFIDLPPMEGAIRAYKRLEAVYDVRILTRPSPLNIACYSEKAYWVLKHLGFEAQEKMVLSCDKSIVKGDYLIDDTLNAKQEEFEGELIRFGTEKFPDWNSVLNKLLTTRDIGDSFKVTLVTEYIAEDEYGNKYGLQQATMLAKPRVGDVYTAYLNEISSGGQNTKGYVYLIAN